MNRQSLLKRKPKTDVAKNFVGVTQYDQKGRPKVLLVPGSEAKRYQVILRRYQLINEDGNPLKKITAECRLETGRGHLGCPGNSRKRHQHQETICYHARAAIDYVIEDAGFKAYWCTSQKDAMREHRMIGGFIMQAASHQNSAVAWIIVVKK